jgi:hypothetical protein
MIELYLSGLTTEVARQIGCSPTAVCRQVREAGLGRARRLDVDDIAARYESGQSTIQIAAAIGSSTGTVSNALRRAGRGRPRSTRDPR